MPSVAVVVFGPHQAAAWQGRSAKNGLMFGARGRLRKRWRKHRYKGEYNPHKHITRGDAFLQIGTRDVFDADDRELAKLLRIRDSAARQNTTQQYGVTGCIDARA